MNEPFKPGKLDTSPESEMSTESSNGSYVFQPPPVEYRIVSPTNDFIRFEEEDTRQSIPSRFEQQVRKYPDRLAAKTRIHSFTYDELNKAANRVAWAILKQCGEGQETIGLLFEHGASIVVALLGVLKAGKIYVPLDHTLPRARLDYMLNDSEAGVILTNNRNVAFARELANDVAQLINIDELDSSLSTENPNLSIPPEAFAYIMYTSGSTGNPKGVIEDHLDVLHFTLWKTNVQHISLDDRISLLGPFCFSGSASYIYPALLNGAALLPFDIKSDGIENLARWLMDEDITVYGSVPGIFRGMVATMTGSEDFPRLRLIQFGGDKVYKRDIELYKRYFSPDCILRVGLGSSELKSFRWFFVDKELEIIGDSVPVGYQIADIEVLLLDDDGNDVGPNQIGEIVVRSKYMSPGYWRKPEATAKTFKPATKGEDNRLYYTGDMGIMAPDGCLYHLGRKDFQVKIGGNRIELGEVENALAALDSVKEAVVVSREDTSGEQRLIAYFVPAANHSPTVSELRRVLSANLPGYMIPSAFVTMDVLPLNLNNKVDRQALPDPDAARPELEEAFIAPRDDLELKLAKIWEEILGIDSVGVQDGFLELGGNSLLAARLFTQIQKISGQELGLSAILRLPTIEKQANLIRQIQSASAYPLLIAIQTDGARIPIFAVHACDGEVLFYRDLAHHLGPEQPFYALRLHGIHGKEVPHDTVEDMAEQYVREIQVIQPEGPYLLCGLGVGGTIAFEMAQQLVSQEQEIRMLALMDPQPRQQVRHPIMAKAKKVGGKLRDRFTPDPQERHRKNSLRTLMRAGKAYVPRVYPGRIIYLASDKQGDRLSPDIWRYWDKLAGGGLDVRKVPGDHGKMLREPHVQVLSEQLKLYLDEAQKAEVY